MLLVTNFEDLMLGLFRLMFFVYMGGAILLIAIGYDYIDKNHPKVNLPYKEQIFGLQNIIVDKVDGFIEKNGKSGRKNKNSTSDNTEELF